MKIVLDSSWRLSAERDGSWMLEHYRPLIKGPRRGELDWAQEGSYDTLGWALHAAWRKMVHDGRADAQASLAQLARRVMEVEKRLLEVASQIPPSLEALPRERKESGVQEISPWGSRPAARRG